jgi:gamma-glutamyltranspeptidase/glutathione hydrolase
VVDGDGNVASMTTSNGETSGDVVPGTGVLLNNMLGEDDLHPDGFHAGPPGHRVASMMAPTLVLSPDGEVVLALGSGGSKRIRTAIGQVVTAVVAHGRELADAVEAPRVHWDGEAVQVEPGLPAGSVAAVRKRWSINEWPARNLYFGGVHAVQPGRAGAGDSRRGGTARLVEE